MLLIDESSLRLPWDLVSFDSDVAAGLAEYAATRAPAKIVARGRRLARDRRVAYIRVAGREVTARALGLSDVYELAALFPAPGGSERWPSLSCSCPFAAQAPHLWCKHQVAFSVMLAAVVDQEPECLMEGLAGWDREERRRREDAERRDAQARARQVTEHRQRLRDERAAMVAAQAQLVADLVDVKVFDVAAQMRRFESICPCPVTVAYPDS